METVEIASRSGDKSSNIYGGVNRITEEEEIEGEMPSLLAINMINGTQSTPTKQDRVIDRDPADADNDHMIIDRNTKLTDYDFQFWNLANSTDVKYEGMLTEETEERKHQNVSYHHEIGELYAEGVEKHMVVLPTIVSSTAEVTIDDI